MIETDTLRGKTWGLSDDGKRKMENSGLGIIYGRGYALGISV